MSSPNEISMPRDEVEAKYGLHYRLQVIERTPNGPGSCAQTCKIILVPGKAFCKGEFVTAEDAAKGHYCGAYGNRYDTIKKIIPFDPSEAPDEFILQGEPPEIGQHLFIGIWEEYNGSIRKQNMNITDVYFWGEGSRSSTGQGSNCYTFGSIVGGRLAMHPTDLELAFNEPGHRRHANDMASASLRPAVKLYTNVEDAARYAERLFKNKKAAFDAAAAIFKTYEDTHSDLQALLTAAP